MTLSIVMAAFVERLVGVPRRVLGIAALATLSGALVLSGHASTAEPLWLARAALVAHVFGFSFWAGALPALATALVRPSVRSTAVLATFSKLIVYAVGLILVSGVLLAILQLGAPGAAWLSAYAAILMAKLTVLAVLFVIAGWNRLILTGPALVGDDAAARKLRALVVVEIVLVLTTFGLVAGWRFTPPPRALAQAAVAELRGERPPAAKSLARTHLHGSGIMADLKVFTDGDVLSLAIGLDPTGPPLDIKSVRVLLTAPVERSVPLERNAVDAAGGHWTTQLPPMMAGRWAVNLEIRVGDFDLLKLKGALQFK
jgi:copper transport protein